MVKDIWRRSKIAFHKYQNFEEYLSTIFDHFIKFN